MCYTESQPRRFKRGNENLVFVRADVHAPTKSVLAPAAILVVLIFHLIFMARQYTEADRTKLSGRPPTCRRDAGDPLDKYTGLVCREGAHASSM